MIMNQETNFAIWSGLFFFFYMLWPFFLSWVISSRIEKVYKTLFDTTKKKVTICKDNSSVELKGLIEYSFFKCYPGSLWTADYKHAYFVFHAELLPLSLEGTGSSILLLYLLTLALVGGSIVWFFIRGQVKPLGIDYVERWKDSSGYI